MDAGRLKILFVASEVTPFAKVGGLGDVIGALPKALSRFGHDVRVLMPLYQCVPKQDLIPYHQPMGVPLAQAEYWCGLREGRIPDSDVPVYFLEYDDFYNRPGVYTSYGDEFERYALLSRGAIQLCRYLHWRPDVIHCNDWQTSLIPGFLNTTDRHTEMARTATLMTIHNLAYQGEFGRSAFARTGLPWHVFHNHGYSKNGHLNQLKGGIFHATLINAVSPTYAKEIQDDYLGMGLDWVLRERSASLYGVLNGIDDDVWNPSTDKHLPANYDVDDMAGKAICKRSLQAELGLPQRDVPLIGFVGRMVYQKGIDVITEALPEILSQDVQCVFLGRGEPSAERAFQRAAAARPDRCAALIEYSERWAHMIEAGSDLFLMPSRFEPCGLNQMYSMRYGTLPIVRATGGLEDTVINHHFGFEDGTGFKLWQLTAEGLAGTVLWAAATIAKQPEVVARMRRRAMRQDFSWRRAAANYESLYHLAVTHRSGIRA